MEGGRLQTNKPIAQSLFGMHDVITQVVVKGARALSRVKRQPRLCLLLNFIFWASCRVRVLLLFYANRSC